MGDGMIRRHLFCAVADVAAAEVVLSALWESDQTGSFSVALSTGGSEPATHAGCSGLFENEHVYVLEAASFIALREDDNFWDAAAGLGLAPL